MTVGNGQLTPDAEQRIREYLQQVETTLHKTDMAPRERANIVEDLRAQIYEMLPSETGREITATEVETVLAQLDPPGLYADGTTEQDMLGLPLPEKPASIPPGCTGERLGPVGAFFGLAFGVVLPLVTIILELFNGACAEILFNPIPTTGHLALISLVPLVNLLLVIFTLYQVTRFPRLMGYASGIAITVAGVYAIPFVLIMPFAVFAIMIWGIGLLPLSPFISLVIGIWLRRRYKMMFVPEARTRVGSGLAGFGLAIALFALISVQPLLTDWLLERATSADPQFSGDAVSWLRRVGSTDQLLRRCYAPSARRGDSRDIVLWTGASIGCDEARKVFYRVTGTPYNTVAPPVGVSDSRRRMSDLMRSPANRDEAVGWLNKDLSLTTSRMDGIVSADAGAGYIEWIVAFKNTGIVRTEARAEIDLPQGGVVSRLTLWINGEEREAAFASRTKVHEAYERVVTVTARDPVIITTCGPDRVLMKCFPVEPGGAEMKMRVGITFPLPLDSRTQARFRLPRFGDRNFLIPDTVSDSVWVECWGAVENRVGALNLEPLPGNRTRITGDIRCSDLPVPAEFQLTRTGQPPTIAVKDPVTSGAGVTQQIIERSVSPPKRVMFAVDTSAGMKPYAQDVVSALAALPAGVQFGVALTGDTPASVSFLGPLPASSDNAAKAAAFILADSCRGGKDNVLVLKRAWEAAGEDPDSVVVWIHAPQPLALTSIDPLLQRAERSTTGPVIWDLQVAPGRSVVQTPLDRIWPVKALARRADLKEDLKALFTSWAAPRKELTYSRQKLAALSAETSSSLLPARLAPHIARLWAQDESLSKYRSRNPKKLEEAVSLAQAYQLVIPATGAVVLENQQMYDQAGLKPVDPSTVPAIPEPETWILIIIAAVVAALAALRYQRKRTLC